MFALEYLNGIVARLDVEELKALWVAQHEGFLIAARPSRALIELNGAMSLMEHRPSVIVLSRPTGAWKMVVLVPDLGTFPAFIEHLSEAGACIQGIWGHCGVVSAEVEGTRAEAVARSLAVPSRGPAATLVGFLNEGPDETGDAVS